MKKNIRVALSFATLPDDELNSFAILVIACVKTNPLFPNLPVPVIGLTALQTAFQNTITAAATGGKQATAAKEEAHDSLTGALRQTAAYVQSLGLSSVSQVLSSGFDVVVPNHTQLPLAQPVITLDNSTTTQLAVLLTAVPNAKAYQLQFYNGTAVWQEAGIFPNSRGIILPNLTPGMVYNSRLRAVGGSTQYSPWSAAVSLMAT